MNIQSPSPEALSHLGLLINEISDCNLLRISKVFIIINIKGPIGKAAANNVT